MVLKVWGGKERRKNIWFYNVKQNWQLQKSSPSVTLEKQHQYCPPLLFLL